MKTFKIFPKAQLELRKGLSITPQTPRSTTIIKEALHHKEIAAADFLDVYKASDPVWHSISFRIYNKHPTY